MTSPVISFSLSEDGGPPSEKTASAIHLVKYCSANDEVQLKEQCSTPFDQIRTLKQRLKTCLKNCCRCIIAVTVFTCIALLMLAIYLFLSGPTSIPVPEERHTVHGEAVPQQPPQPPEHDVQLKNLTTALLQTSSNSP